MSQLDWHPGQILCKEISTSDTTQAWVHCILVDFGAVWIFSDEFEYGPADDYAEALRSLLYPPVGLDPELVWNSFEARETWDLSATSVLVGAIRRPVLPADPFEFVWKRSIA